MNPAPETPDTEPPAIAEAWGPLHSWACSQRRDWDPYAVKGAMREAASRSAGYRDVAVILWRLSWDLSARTREVLGELSNLNRFNVPRADRSPEAVAALKAGDYAKARQLEGTASVIPALPLMPAVPVQGTAPETETGTEGGR